MSSTYPAGNPIAYLFDDDDDARAEGEDGGGGDRGTRSVGDGLYDVAASSLRRSLRFGVSLSFYLPYIFGFFLLLSIAHLHVAGYRSGSPSSSASSSRSRRDHARRRHRTKL